jgi:hypothetical protein
MIIIFNRMVLEEDKHFADFHLLADLVFSFALILYHFSQPVAQPGFLDQWASFACVGEKRWAKWARLLLMGPTKY